MVIYKIRDKATGEFVSDLARNDPFEIRKHRNEYAILGWKGRLWTEWGALMKFVEKLATEVRGYRDPSIKYTHEDNIKQIAPNFEIVRYTITEERVVTSVEER